MKGAFRSAEDAGRPRPRDRAMMVLALTVTLGGCTDDVGPSARPPGADQGLKSSALEAGAKAIQRDAPPDALDIYLAGFHPLKGDPSHQFEAHHFCRQVNEEFMQCALFDGNSAEANLSGIEYIISERLFEGLPPEERQFWHPHNGEILSGQLVAPGLPEVAEHALMKTKVNSYGKTWHTWDTSYGGPPGESLPLGPPHLAWSFSRFGELRPELLAQRDRRLGIDTAERRASRQDLVPLARPQAGVDALACQFPRPTEPIPGVIDKAATPASPGDAR